MNTRYNFTLALFMNLIFLFISCSNNNDDIGVVNPQNKALVGTKWTLTNWDYSIGDDYIGFHDYTINIFFYSGTEGLIYYGKKDNYTDIGSSSYRSVSHFNFNVSDDNIYIDYITDETSEANFTKLTIKGDYIITNGYEFQKNSISSNDNTWLSTLHGKTGDCSWYHDLNKTLYIIGEGKMADYDSPNNTPWVNRPFNILEITDGVTSIGNNAFAFKSLAEVKLPYSSLTRIGNNAFSGSSISKIYLSNDIRKIEDEAFSNCSYLANINLPSNIEVIGNWAFSNCKNASLKETKRLKEIGDFAFNSCKVDYFTDSEVLEKVGESAFTNLLVDKLTLPNSLKEIKHLSFNGNFNEIHIGTGLEEITGTPFYPNATGEIYVNLGNPISLNYAFLEPASGWTLYVPQGCKSAYSKALYWKDFKRIIEDKTLIPGNGQPNVDDDNEGVENITIPKTYSNAGKIWQWIRVESPTLPTFYIMQTELNVSSHFRIDKQDIGVLNKNGDRGVTKGELRTFLENIKELTGIQMRLPTREEWVYAAKGGNKSMGYTYSGSNSIDKVAWYRSNSKSCAQDFALKLPNELGLYDMSGNYEEITNDNIYDIPNVNGYVCGGCFNDGANECKITSYKNGVTSGNIPESNLKEYNAFDIKQTTVRLVFTAPY